MRAPELKTQLLENLIQPRPNSPEWILSLKYYITESKMQLKISRSSSLFLFSQSTGKGKIRGIGEGVYLHMVFFLVVSTIKWD